MDTRRALAAVAALILSGVSCSGDGMTSPEPTFRQGIAARQVSVDFSSFGSGKNFDSDFYRSDGIVFSAEQCGDSGCVPWFIGFFSGDAAIVVGEAPQQDVPLQATFTRPISGLRLRIAPGLQGTAIYVLKIYDPAGRILATKSVSVTEDLGDPASIGLGYFVIAVTNLPRPAKSFTVTNAFVRSSHQSVDHIPFGISTITYTHWGGQH